MRYTRLLIGTLVTVGLLAALWVSPASAQPGFNPPGLAQAIAAQERHTDALLAREGVVGTAVGLNPAGKPVVQVFTEREGVPGIPSSLDRVPVVVRVTGEFVAEDPVPIGVSSSNENSFIRNGAFCTTGTLGSRLVDDKGTDDLDDDLYFAISNNHIFANENGSFGAGIDTDIIQPGLADSGCTTTGTTLIGTLSAYVPIEFDRRANNVADVAIASTTPDLVGTFTPEFLADGTTDDDRYEPSTGNLKCAGNCSNLLNKLVKKYGRTTELTHGVISGVNAITIIRYDSGRTRFVDQLIIDPVGPTEDFSAGGDSGSMVVTEIGENPVGLHFAGGDIVGIANRIDYVFLELANAINDVSTVVGMAVTAFISVDGKAPVPPTPGITVNPTSGLVTTETGGQDTFDVVLDTLPSHDVTISVSSSDITEGTVSPSILTFSPANGTTAQTVTVTGVDDALADGDIPYIITTEAAVSDDDEYDNMNPSDVSVTNTDDEAAASGTGTVQGRVTNAATGQKISGATVDASTGVSTNTNNGGKYSLDVPEGLQDITASADDCTDSTALDVNVLADGSVKQDFALSCL